MIFESPWEKDCNNNKAIFKELDRLKINRALSKKFALLKMTEITLISGYFQGNQLLFYPSTWVLFDSSDKLEFFGLYGRELEQNNIQDVLPVACLRRACWMKDIDIKAYKTAKTPGEYIENYLLTDKHVISQNSFLSYDLALPILTLASEIANHIRHGVEITEKSNHNKPEFEYIKYSSTEKFRVSYSSSFLYYLNKFKSYLTEI